MRRLEAQVRYSGRLWAEYRLDWMGRSKRRVVVFAWRTDWVLPPEERVCYNVFLRGFFMR